MKSVLVLAAEGFEEIEALTVVDVLRRAGITCDLCSLVGDYAVGAHGVKVACDTYIDHENTAGYDAIILPGGMPGTTNLKNSAHTLDLVREYYSSGKIIGAICAAPIVLQEAGLLNGRTITSYPSLKKDLDHCIYDENLVVVDENIITSRGPATALPFALEIIKQLGLAEESEKIKEDTLFSLI